jgi:hypothetical protein
MSQFDIAQYADFRPPRYLCPRCASIWQEDIHINWPDGWGYEYRDETPSWTCPVCHLRFEESRDFSDLEPYLRRWDCVLEFTDLTHQLQVLASAAAELRSKDGRFERPKRSLRNLLAALNQAQHFVHLMSTGISWDFIGMLALLSHRVAVRGIITIDDERKANQLRESQPYGGKTFEVVPLSSRSGRSAPHQKLIVIDGFLAISGSINFTIESWCKLDDGHEHATIETRPEEVWRLNNTLFSPVWGRLHRVAKNVTPMRRRGPTWADSLKHDDNASV